ncbi:hypothetical protein [Paenibacillus sp. GbtcB18]|uniref:hypothetical protein n=1 Tax=Paenibacillus sp. GbtcB18 TaxID=2824763 RepID=UPI001C305D1B|nr:hypothetical protein [Paenibacillus sp. GbtcB18]
MSVEEEIFVTWTKLDHYLNEHPQRADLMTDILKTYIILGDTNRSFGNKFNEITGLDIGDDLEVALALNEISYNVFSIREFKNEPFFRFLVGMFGEFFMNMVNRFADPYAISSIYSTRNTIRLTRNDKEHFDLTLSTNTLLFSVSRMLRILQTTYEENDSESVFDFCNKMIMNLNDIKSTIRPELTDNDSLGEVRNE